MEFYGFMAYMIITNLGWRIEDLKKVIICQTKYFTNLDKVKRV